MRKVVTGDQVAQIYNRDPFAVPAWRAPVYRTPLTLVLIVHAARLLWRLARFVTRHTAAILAVLAWVLAWRVVGTAGLLALVLSAAAVLVAWRWRFPAAFTRWIGTPARSKWRAVHYRRRWGAVMTIGRLAPSYQGRVGPVRRPRRGRFGVHPPRRPGRHHSRPAHPGARGSAGAASRQA